MLPEWRRRSGCQSDEADRAIRAIPAGGSRAAGGAHAARVCAVLAPGSLEPLGGDVVDDFPTTGCQRYSVGSGASSADWSDTAVGALAGGRTRTAVVGPHERLQSGSLQAAAGSGPTGERVGF